MELSQAISQAINEFGKDIITEPRFVNILADYDAFAEARVLRTVVRDMVDQGFTRKIIVRKYDVKHADEVTKGFVYEALNQFPYREELVQIVVSAFVYSIVGFGNQTKKSKRNSTKNISKKLVPNPLSDFDISNDGKTLIKGKNTLAGVVVIPEGIEIIGKEAFYENQSITNVLLPEGIKSIGDSAFCDCPKLIEVRLPNSLEKIDICCFRYCYKLKSLFIPKNVKELGYGLCNGGVVVDSRNMNFMSENGTVLSRDRKVLYHVPKDVTEYSVPIGVEEIECAFYDCEHLQKVKLSGRIKKINFAFTFCWKLKMLTLPNCIESVNLDSFSYTSLSKVIIPANVRCITAVALLPSTSSFFPKLYFESTSPQAIEWQLSPEIEQTFWESLGTIYVPVKALDAYKSATRDKIKVIPY